MDLKWLGSFANEGEPTLMWLELKLQKTAFYCRSGNMMSLNPLGRACHGLCLFFFICLHCGLSCISLCMTIASCLVIRRQFPGHYSSTPQDTHKATLVHPLSKLLLAPQSAFSIASLIPLGWHVEAKSSGSFGPWDGIMRFALSMLWEMRDSIDYEAPLLGRANP